MMGELKIVQINSSHSYLKDKNISIFFSKFRMKRRYRGEGHHDEYRSRCWQASWSTRSFSGCPA